MSSPQTLGSENFCREKDIRKVKIQYLNDRINYVLDEIRTYGTLKLLHQDLAKFLEGMSAGEVKGLYDEYSSNHLEGFMNAANQESQEKAKTN